MEYIKMGISVIFTNGKVGHIDSSTLDHLIWAKDIVAFRRSEGWVRIDCDPIRNAQQPLMRSGKRWDDVPLLPVL